MTAIRRYLTIIQDPLGYPADAGSELAPPEGPEPPTLYTVVKADEHESALAEAVKALEAIVDAGRVSDDNDGWVYARRLRDIASDALVNLKRGQ